VSPISELFALGIHRDKDSYAPAARYNLSGAPAIHGHLKNSTVILIAASCDPRGLSESLAIPRVGWFQEKRLVKIIQQEKPSL
jgi:hypothetical protein